MEIGKLSNQNDMQFHTKNPYLLTRVYFIAQYAVTMAYRHLI